MTQPTEPQTDAPIRPTRVAGRLTEGSTLRHVIEMTAAGSIGLIAVFFVDFLSLFYISRLNNEEVTAGVGYAVAINFFAISINVGLMVGCSALTARALGMGDRDKARRIASTGLAFSIASGAVASVILLLLKPAALHGLGAEGVPHEVASRFLVYLLISNPIMAAQMTLNGLLRALGDARRAMTVTLAGSLATAVLDPLFIFGLGMGADGAALATVCARIIFSVSGWRGVHHHHRLLAWPSRADMRHYLRPLAGIAAPTVMTNLASPAGAAFLLAIVRQFGHEAIAAQTIIDRLVPLAYGVIFALSGSVGPILAQNLGARKFDRVRSTLRDATLSALVYCLIVWLLLAVFSNTIPQVFGASDMTGRYVSFFCAVGAAAWVFNSLLFVANATFNNLGFALYSTLFNWGRATLGTVPFAYAGAQWAGYEGALLAIVLGWALFGISSIVVAFRAITRLEEKARAGVPPTI